jgi:hypothetical protein
VQHHRASEPLREGGRPDRGRETPENENASPPRNENTRSVPVVER